MPDPYLDSRPICRIDAHDRLLSANDAWFDFHRYVLHAEGSKLIGQPIWQLQPAHEVRQLWEVLYRRVRNVHAPLFLHMRADIACERRLVDVELYPLPDQCIEQVYEPVWSQRRAPVALLDVRHPRDERELTVCAWCSRVQVRIGVWQEVELAQEILGIDASRTAPILKTRACNDCKQAVLKSFPATGERRAASA